MSETFERAKRMLYSSERLLEPILYFNLLDMLTPQQRQFLYRESEIMALAPDVFKEGRRRLQAGRQRLSGGGRKRLTTRLEYANALLRSVKLHEPTSPLPRSCQSVRSIAADMKRLGVNISPASLPSQMSSIDCRLHPCVKLPSRLLPIDPHEQFAFINRRLEHILGNSQLALVITADPVRNTPHNGRADRLESRRGYILANHVAMFLIERHREFAMAKITDLLILIEAGGLLGLRNKIFLQNLQLVANKTGINIFLSLLPRGITRLVSTPLEEKCCSLIWQDETNLGYVSIQIGEVNPLFIPSVPQDGNFQPSSWNRIFRPANTVSINDNQTTPGDGPQDASADFACRHASETNQDENTRGLQEEVSSASGKPSQT